MAVSTGDREKIVSKLPRFLWQQLKVRAAQRKVDVQDAVSDGLEQWCHSEAPSEVDTSGAESFSTWLPPGQWEQFKRAADERTLSQIQGLSQAVSLWLEEHPSPPVTHPQTSPRRIIVCNQKGGVGKTAVSAGLGEAFSEPREELFLAGGSKYLGAEESDRIEKPGLGQRVLLVDFDPQCHLTQQLGYEPLPLQGDSLTKHMSGEANGELRDLVMPVQDERFDGQLSLLPSCTDAFLLDVKLASIRAREAALERALAPVESEFDVIIVDCPPSLGLSMDTAAYYGRRRVDSSEAPENSGVLIVVQAEDTSADAYQLLTSQIHDLRSDLSLDVNYLGIVVNQYDARRGFIATSSLQQWQAIQDPAVVGVLGDLKEQKEAVRTKRPLLAYAPRSSQAMAMRAMAREIS